MAKLGKDPPPFALSRDSHAKGRIMQDTAIDPWGLVLIIGPLLLLGVILYAWSRNRAAMPKDAHGDTDTGATVGRTNAVRGSEDARPDIEAEAARAESGDDRPA